MRIICNSEGNLTKSGSKIIDGDSRDMRLAIFREFATKGDAA
jgi:hypothetical protein